MLRAGVSLPAVMKLLGHLKPEMTMRYGQASILYLQREFHLALSQPRHLLPASRRPASISSRQVTPPCHCPHACADHPSLSAKPTWQVCSIPCMSLSTFWKCSAVRFPKDLIVVSSTASPIVSPRSPQKHDKSAKRRTRQKLAS